MDGNIEDQLCASVMTFTMDSKRMKTCAISVMDVSTLNCPAPNCTPFVSSCASRRPFNSFSLAFKFGIFLRIDYAITVEAKQYSRVQG